MNIFRMSVISITLFFMSGCAIYHSYGPYYGKVVDAETKAPLEGAAVLAEYMTRQYGSPGGPVGYFLNVQEVTTDKGGEFRIPSFNAFTFRILSTFNPQPYFIIFKPRYKCYTRSVAEDKYENIELTELKTINARIENTHCNPIYVPKNKMKLFIEVRNIEKIDLGLPSIPVSED